MSSSAELKLLLLLVLGVGVSSGLKVNVYGGYDDLVVSVGSDVPQATCGQLIQGIRETFYGASQYLNNATEGKLYYSRITIVLPPDWDLRKCSVSAPVKYVSASWIQDASFRVTAEHPVMGSMPYTQQSQGCGKSGDYVSLSYRFFLNGLSSQQGQNVTKNPAPSSSSSSSTFAQRSLVHEWAKYRYGVFEERGFDGDPVFPPVYVGESGGEAKPNFCTDKELKGSFGSDCSKSAVNCSYNIFMDQNENLSSSIMSVPGLPGVVKFCDKSTHNAQSPTKHNFQCMNAPVADVMAAHGDFIRANEIRQPRSIGPSIEVRQLIRPRIVLLVEESGYMSARETWKFLKLAVSKLIKYDLENGVQVGMITVNGDKVKILANMTTLDNVMRGILPGKLPNYPDPNKRGSLSVLEGVSQSINMLKANGGRVAGSVIILISPGGGWNAEEPSVEATMQLARQEDISIATIEYPSNGNGSVMAALSRATNSPHYIVKETAIGSGSHLSTYVRLVEAMSGIQNYFFSPIPDAKITTLVHQQEFKANAKGTVESSFSFDYNGEHGEFQIYVPNPNDPRVNEVQLISPSGRRYNDQLRQDDINVIKVVAKIDEPGLWQYKIERFPDGHQSHFVQVVSTGSGGRGEDLAVKVFTNVESSRVVDMNREPLLLFVDVKRGLAPVLNAEVVARIKADEYTWDLPLWDNGNGDPDITAGDGVYSRYVVPPVTIRDGDLEISVKVFTSPNSKYPTWVPGRNSADLEPCCGSRLVTEESYGLKSMSNEQRVAPTYTIRVLNIQTSSKYPPGRVGDLRVEEQEEKKVTLGFTAPGDDYDSGRVAFYEFFYNESNSGEPRRIGEQVTSTKHPGGTEQFVFDFPDFGVYHVWMQSIDPFKNPSLRSNIVVLNVASNALGSNNNNTNGSFANSQAATRKLDAKETALLVVGILLVVVIIVAIVVLCICCRRRNAKRDVNATDPNIYTISSSTNKEPIHWSASQLLQVHEKRLSLYGNNSHRTENIGPGLGGGDQGGRQQGGRNNTSPGSSTRSFRSFNEGQMRESFDASGGRRPTMTDYDSCSSDPIIRGPADYDTAVDSDVENVNYRSIDSYVGATYRAVINTNPSFTPTPKGSGNLGHHHQSGLQYSSPVFQQSSYQGSVTSINTKRRNVTMV